MMAGAADLLSSKLYRAGEALNLILRYAADGATRRALIHIYASLSKPDRYNDPIKLSLRLGAQVFPFHMRLSDIFIIGEILHEQQYAMQSTLPDDAVIIDAGGNIGVSTVWFLGHHPDATLHVFEPASDNLVYLEKNIAHWPKARLFHEAVGAEAGSLTLHYGAFGGMHSLLENAPETGVAEETVKVVTLADHMAEHGLDRIDLLKLDIEGSEFDALRGLGDRIADVRVIVGEVHEAMIDVDAFYRFLEDAGFHILWRKRFRESEAQQVHGFEAARIAT